MYSEPLRKPSTSCENCRVVKRRCDKKRPQCGQCIRSSQECSGYRDEWQLIFRDQTRKTIQSTRKPRIRKSNQPSPSSLSDESQDGMQQPNLLHVIPSGAMIGSQIFATYLDSYFPRDVKPTCVVNLSYPIISSIHTLPQKSIMLQKATSALSYVFLGKFHGDKPVLQHGIGLYNEAIYEMSKTLSRKDYGPDLIYTCQLFEQIENHYCPDSLDKRHAHIDGLTAIMSSYHPKKDDPPTILIIYGQYQKLRVLLSRLMRLSDPLIRWLREPGEGLLHELIQLLTDLSCLAAAVDTTNQAEPLDQQGRQSLLFECMELERRHLEFYTKISGNSHEDPPTYKRGELKTGLPATDDLFGPAFRFRSVSEANLHLFVWTSLSLLYPIIHQASILIESDDCIPKILLVDGQSPRDVAHQLSAVNIRKALRCLPYCTQEGLNLWGIFYCIFPVIQATRVFSHTRDWERFVWSLDLFKYISASGFDIASRYYDLCRIYWFNPTLYGESSSYRLPDPNGPKNGHPGAVRPRIMSGESDAVP